jgi:hypothetical protein
MSPMKDRQHCRLLLPERAEVQNEVRDARLQRQGEPRRRLHMAERLRAEGVDRRRRGENRRAREESRELATGPRPRRAAPARPRRAEAKTALDQVLGTTSSERSASSSLPSRDLWFGSCEDSRGPGQPLLDCVGCPRGACRGGESRRDPPSPFAASDRLSDLLAQALRPDDAAERGRGRAGPVRRRPRILSSGRRGTSKSFCRRWLPARVRVRIAGTCPRGPWP